MQDWSIYSDTSFADTSNDITIQKKNRTFFFSRKKYSFNILDIQKATPGISGNGNYAL